ncbi:protein FAM177A1 isoform X1 [Boleophthalmus pectinirostris]|uniref:protein FAM177A1 isoform X1 n=2 Tax=Boleophthalmus pectinirostris TaxID=150288 RepID=UPI000A1C3703|nr:protein FAM177A1 isoform X1 [Boleophthalmus pectinirostris]
MAQLSLYLTNINISLGQTMENEKGVDGSTSLEMQDMSQKKVKVPRRTIYFASGETMEEYSTDEEEDVEPAQKDVLPVDTSKMTWGPYVWFQMWRMATSTVSVCDYMGEKMASLFGITTPKYQYAIDEYYRIKKEEEEEEEENRLAEEAERQFQQSKQPSDSTTMQQPESSFVNINFDIEHDSCPESQDINGTDG